MEGMKCVSRLVSVASQDPSLKTSTVLCVLEYANKADDVGSVEVSYGYTCTSVAIELDAAEV